jgi:hypothetical protein
MYPTFFGFEDFHVDYQGSELSRNGRGVEVARRLLELLIPYGEKTRTRRFALICDDGRSR